MPKVSVSEAARLVGKSRITLHRHIERGRLSKEIDEAGNPVIDTSELVRVYGALRPATGSRGVSKDHPATSGNSLLRAEVETLRERLALLVNERDRERQVLQAQIADLIEDRGKWREQAERATRLIADQRPPETEQAARLEGELAEVRRRLDELGRKKSRQGRSWLPWRRRQSAPE